MVLWFVVFSIFVSVVAASPPLPRKEDMYDHHGLDFGKIGVLNFATPDVWSYAKYSVRLWQRYADRHGYEFFIEPMSMNRSRHDVWTKVLATEKYLPLVDYLLFAEADTVPFDEPRSVEKQLIQQFMPPDSETIMMLGTNCGYERYCFDKGPNTGVYLVRNTPLAMQMLRDWWLAAEPGQPCHRYFDWHPREQLTFWHCIMENRTEYAEPVVKMINYKHIHGLDGEYIHHLMGAAFSLDRKLSTMYAPQHS